MFVLKFIIGSLVGLLCNFRVLYHLQNIHFSKFSALLYSNTSMAVPFSNGKLHKSKSENRRTPLISKHTRSVLEERTSFPSIYLQGSWRLVWNFCCCCMTEGRMFFSSLVFSSLCLKLVIAGAFVPRYRDSTFLWLIFYCQMKHYSRFRCPLRLYQESVDLKNYPSHSYFLDHIEKLLQTLISVKRLTKMLCAVLML